MVSLVQVPRKDVSSGYGSFRNALNCKQRFLLHVKQKQHRDVNQLHESLQRPDEESQLKHMLTHLPFADWCQDCVAHRSRQDPHRKDGSVKDFGIPTISFDFAYTQVVAPGGDVQATETVAALILVDSVTNFTGSVPISKKNDFDLMISEILPFTQTLGYAECNYLCDNEPSILQVQKRAVHARKQFGLTTHSQTPEAYSHGNSLCENTVRRVRELAGTLMHHVQDKISTALNTDHGLWSWAMRHSSWLLNRFAVVHGSTPYELVYQKIYKGKMTEFGEPAFAFTHTALKGNPKWQRVLVLGKTETQDTYIVYIGSAIMLTRSVRRIATLQLGRFKSGFGGRIIPTKCSIAGQSASFKPPDTPVLPHPLHDADGEAVRKKMIEEKGEEREAHAMGSEDTNAMEDQVDLTFEGGTSAPITPPLTSPAPPTPRHPHASGAHAVEPDVGHEAKKAQVEVQKKQKINQLRECQETMIRVVKIGSEEFATLDSYDTELNLEEDEHEDDLWSGEDQLQFDEVPEALWSNMPLDKVPPPPEPWVDQIADELEIQRLLVMGVLEKADDAEEISNVFMVHVDDLLFAGSQKFWTEKFLPKMQSKFSVSFNELKGVGSAISFLKRRLVRLADGLMIVPGTTTDKVVACFEKHFGQAKIQKVPCDPTIQNEDNSPGLSPSDSSSYRSVIGLLLYLSRDRLDTMFVVKELAACMSTPTLVALQKLRKLVGYLKGTGYFGVKLAMPEHGAGRWKTGGEHYWLVACFTDAD
eukprot:s4574_g4.t1